MLVQREDVDRARLAVRSAVAAASALINDRVTPVPVDKATALQLWFGLSAELLEELGDVELREKLEIVIKFVTHNRTVTDALDAGADAGVVVHPPDCPCGLCK